MTSSPRALAGIVWFGIALAGLFFYPLAAALDGNIYYLQWQPAHGGEALLAFGLLAVCGAAAARFCNRLSGRSAAVAWLLLTMAPFASFATAIARQVKWAPDLIRLWEHPLARIGLPAAIVTLLIAAVARRPALTVRAIRSTVAILSPIAVVVLVAFARASTHPGPVLRADRRDHRMPTDRVAPCSSVVALLFDELSFAYLYDQGRIRADFPHLRAFAAESREHLNVVAPGPDTLVSLPGFLTGRRIAGIAIDGERILEGRPDGSTVALDVRSPEGLFAGARALGFSAEMAGYYFPYCAMLGDFADTCRSFSFYNTSTVSRAFSPLHPLSTTLILWPRQFPFGIVKSVPFAVHQRNLVRETIAFAARPIERDQPVFRFVHVSIPHLPFAFGAGGFRPRLDALRTRPDDLYVDQLRYVDELVGRLFARWRLSGALDRATIVVLADHGFRFGGRERDPLHIPFIVRRAGRPDHDVVSTVERGERLLPRVLADACGAEASPVGIE
jgi:hypothetical protein